MANRRCESCGSAMPKRMYRQRDEGGKLVCDGCKAHGLGAKEWNVAYARKVLPAPLVEEFDRRQAEALASLVRVAGREDDPEYGWCTSCEQYIFIGEADEMCPGSYGIPGISPSPHQITWPEPDEDAHTAAVHQYGGAFEIYDTVRTKDGRTGTVSALYPDMPYYAGRTVQVRFGTRFDDEGYEIESEQGIDYDRFAEADLTMVTPSPVRTKPYRTSVRKTAHDSGDGATIYHCPFCGSGQVTGGYDGTVSCGFCHQNFTVQVQPEFQAMPQTINGVPFNIPGMPGGGPDAGAAPTEEAAQVGEAQEGQPEQPEEPEQVGSPFPASQAMLVVRGGTALPVDKALQHYALAYATDRDAVLARVREENAR